MQDRQGRPSAIEIEPAWCGKAGFEFKVVNGWCSTTRLQHHNYGCGQSRIMAPSCRRWFHDNDGSRGRLLLPRWAYTALALAQSGLVGGGTACNNEMWSPTSSEHGCLLLALVPFKQPYLGLPAWCQTSPRMERSPSCVSQHNNDSVTINRWCPSCGVAYTAHHCQCCLE